MKIAVIGASGKAGSLIAQEALNRGHEVTAIVRNASKLKGEYTSAIEKDLFDLTAEDLKPFDVVVNAYSAPHGSEHLHVEAGRVLINALKGAPDTKLFVVGGAGSLYADEAKTIKVMDTPDFPSMYYPTASNQGKNLEDLQQSEGITWTFLSPSAFFDAEGKRSGAYKAGKDQLLVNSKGESYISYADYAIAALDEIENPKHVNERFTVVGEHI
ncbi:NAD(P)-dependent oxidoreductase [Paenibacillus donghaensis]|jgi:putative NADH-flavin reductase|uniref:NAD(P)-dependent oxidoreductase n=1 Tax=Paenibacillus donghaensis TaxID=414771 RepID=UPI0018832AFA|nr:NAD(P)-dependent oxidoreductase [Paenibacillus donghaensis]MBE9916517.1 NAD(P)-dependent oxidoreductase [Paenibacillus donghaensis]